MAVFHIWGMCFLYQGARVKKAEQIEKSDSKDSSFLAVAADVDAQSEQDTERYASKSANGYVVASSGELNTLGCFYEWILNSTIIFAACAFVISVFNYFTADDPITEKINMGTLLISGAIVGLLTAVRWLMGAMSTHLSNQAQIIELMSKKDGNE